jgi:hypothetical protein
MQDHPKGCPNKTKSAAPHHNAELVNDLVATAMQGACQQ